MMIDESQDQQIRKLLAAIETIRTPLTALTRLHLANEFYTKEERAKLYAAYQKLLDADAAAFSRLSETTPRDKLSWDARVEKHGEAAAKAQLAPKTAALAEREATGQRLTEFRREHQLLIRLLESKAVLEKGEYD